MPTNPTMVATIVERGLYGGLARWLNMAKVPIKVVEADGTTKIRSYAEFTGDTTGMHIEIRMSNHRVSLVAPIRLNATRENLDRVQGHIPDDYYSRFDRYPKGKHHFLRDRAETGPVCANEFGFTKALATCNWNEHENELACMQFDRVQRHYYADQRYHLLMKPLVALTASTAHQSPFTTTGLGSGKGRLNRENCAFHMGQQSALAHGDGVVSITA